MPTKNVKWPHMRQISDLRDYNGLSSLRINKLQSDNNNDKFKDRYSKDAVGIKDVFFGL